MNLQNKYSRDQFLSFIDSFVPNFKKDIRKVNTRSLKATSEAFYLGESPDLDLAVFELAHISTSDARVTLATEGFRVMKDSANYRALIAYRPERSDDWRLSLMTATPDTTEKGKVILKLSNPRRYSFFLGESAKVNTPHKFLIRQGAVTDFEDLQKRFSLEVVNKEFYKQISESFIKLVGGTLGTGKNEKKYKALLKLPSVADHSQTSLEFGVRLIGRLIFCWFLREKKSSEGEPLMPKKLLSLEALSGHSDYYHKVLEPIFFEVLNKPVKSRKDDYSENSFSLIPYLNGGLFSPHEDDFYSYNGGRQAVNHNTVVVPDSWFEELFKTLETYNFTIDENTSFDEELSIDPEMLGRIFENLLAEINPETGESARKSTGSYYTPRVIVDYMVDESLILYLKEQAGIDEGKIRAIVSYDLTDDTEHPPTSEEKAKILDSLENLKLLDPACGSGAFPIGALQKIVFILQQLDPNGQMWFKKQLGKTSPELRRVLEREFENQNFDYIRKLGIIRENIYGVDIQSIATEISRLRCFLTLIVDERVDDSLENRGIEPLPNLDFKFVTANSLVGLPTSDKHNQMGLFEDDKGIGELKEIRDMFFTASGVEREQLKLQFVQAQNKMFQRLIQEGRRGHADLTTKLSSWDPFSHQASLWFDPEWMFGLKSGFDMVMANPPYIASYGRQAQKYDLKDIRYYLDSYSTFKSVRKRKNISVNTVMLFIEKGLGLLKINGSLTYIVDQALLNVDVYKYTRKFLLDESTLVELVTNLYFPQVIAEACIVHASNKKSPDTYYFKWKKKDVGNIPNKIDITSAASSKNHSLTLSVYGELTSKIEKESDKLANCSETFTGMQIIPEYFLSNDDKVVEQSKWHKAVFSNNINSYGIVWPTKRQKGKYITYDNELQNEVREKLKVKLARGEKVRSPESLSIGSPDKEYRFFTPKIMMSQTVSNANGKIRLQAALDDNVGYYGNVSIHLIKHGDTDFLKYLLAILNSKLISFYAIEKKLILGAEQGSKKTPQIRKGAIDLLPIKIVEKPQQKSLIELVEKIISITGSSDYLQDSAKLTEVKKYEDRVDRLVCELYDLTDEEIKIVEGKL